MNEARRILITGAHGFIGSHLVRRLVNEGYNVGITRRVQSDMVRIQDLLSEVKSYSVDIRDAGLVYNVISDFQPDYIIHLATYSAVEHTPAESKAIFETNVLGTINLLEAACQCGVELFINTSSCFVYDDAGKCLNEEDLLKPHSLYALTKQQAEEACSFYADTYALQCVTLRLFHTYGPADNECRLIPYTIKTFFEGNSPYLTTGRQKWDFVYVTDIVDAYESVLSRYESLKMYEIFNVGTGEATSVRKVVKTIRDSMGVDVDIKWGERPHRRNEVWFNSADIHKIKNMLGWEPRTSIKEGLNYTIEWCMSLAM